MRDERGYAVVEAFLVGLVLIVPVIWLLTCAATIHRTALASSSAVREAGLVASRASGFGDAHRRARLAIARALSERGIEPKGSKISLFWPPEQNAAVEVRLEVPVSVLTIPFVGTSAGPRIWLRARHVARLEPYRSLDG